MQDDDARATADRGARGRLIASLAGTLLFAYVVSIGPVGVYCDAHRSGNEATYQALQKFYAPVLFLAKASPVTDRVATSYYLWCQRMMYPKFWKPVPVDTVEPVVPVEPIR